MLLSQPPVHTAGRVSALPSTGPASIDHVDEKPEEASDRDASKQSHQDDKQNCLIVGFYSRERVYW